MVSPSRFRTGQLVQVRSKEEILATLDSQGCLEGMPFMPEMLQFCGQRIRVGAVAHKTCDTAHKTWKARGVNATVHLEGLRCDGAAHGGCQADCNIFWKDAWLKPAGEPNGRGAKARAGNSIAAGGCTEQQLTATTLQTPADTDGEPRYSCQATRLYDATEPLDWWDVRQYIRDVTFRNHSAGRVVGVIWLAFVKLAQQRIRVGYRLSTWVRAWMHRRVLGREIPDFAGTIKRGQPTPGGRLDLKAGERVRIKPKEEIVKTIDGSGNNRGLRFDVEMSPYCGRVATVRRSVTRIIDEPSGRMRHMKQPCIILQDVVCNADYSECRLLCPRQIPSFWREIWLERIENTEGVQTR